MTGSRWQPASESPGPSHKGGGGPDPWPLTPRSPDPSLSCPRSSESQLWAQPGSSSAEELLRGTGAEGHGDPFCGTWRETL